MYFLYFLEIVSLKMKDNFFYNNPKEINLGLKFIKQRSLKMFSDALKISQQVVNKLLKWRTQVVIMQNTIRVDSTAKHAKEKKLGSRIIYQWKTFLKIYLPVQVIEKVTALAE